MTTPEIIQLGSAVATTAGVVVACITIYLNTRRAKKELAVKLLNDWSIDYNLSMKHAFELAKVLGEEQIVAIQNKDTNYLANSEQNMQYISYILGQSCDWQKNDLLRILNDDGKHITLTTAQCTTISFKWMQMLHRVEAILIAKNSRAADSRLMKKQFDPLVEDNKSTFRKLVDAWEGQQYPNITRELTKHA